MRTTALLLLLLFACGTYAQQQTNFADTTAKTREITTKYFDLYMAMDWNKIEPLCHDQITFEDPTAHLIFGDKKPTGKANVMKHFREGYASLTEMKAKLTRTFFSGDLGVFELDLTFGFRNRQNGITTITMPLVVSLWVKGGKVIEHRDYGDYTEYVRQIKAAQAAQSPEK